MSNLVKLDFNPLDISGENYLYWAVHAREHLVAEGLGDTIKDGNEASSRDKAKAVLILRRHLSEEFFSMERDPLVLWKDLKGRYELVQKTIMLNQARHEWEHLRVQDFKSVVEYNSALCRTISQMVLGGGVELSDEDMLEKTYSTLRTSNVHLQNICRERICKTYWELNNYLLLAEQNNEIYLKNHESYPDGPSPFRERNEMSHYHNGKQNQHYGRRHGRGYNHGRGRGRGRGREYYRGRGRGNWNHRGPSNNFYSHLRCNKNDEKGKNNRRWA